ncbi:glycosyltransferase family 2 protein [Gillisia limnaea]|uniref:N-acetylglucosaminyltransferase n=1 Tax=Gillisia limnaea (strain DSM 15749 / LMG 21470 / R-8282) TaxID=865937 RepID=H2BSW2_GILLR|nr:glycosyltransferase [Gillisia limnaea]EHQ01492.1 glycosyl transferase family 2 [Gillisia limnaea DSM 15749]
MITEELTLASPATAKKISLNDTAQQKGNASRETEKEKVSDNYRKAIFTKRHHFTLAMTFLLLLGGAFSVYLLQPQFEEMNLSRMDTLGGMILLFLGVFLLLFRLSFLAYIARLFFRYKPVTSVKDEELPTSTVIVPAYNEGQLVYSTLLSLVNSDYPAEKLQLLAIDDGSKDDTWEWMKKAKEQLGDRVSIYQQPENQGKRHALYRGFNLATGEVFVTVDSDSIVEKDTLRNLVSPFVTNENCGAVAGNVRVLNNEKAIIPRMLNVSFVFSFEFIRSAQSVLGSVLCTPGALAAYRSKAVMNCLPEWINQTFMGQPTDIGEDRAMTNMILKQGFHVLFQRNAYVLTNIPEKFSSLHKMFTRWERSNVRENLMMSKFAFKPFRNGPKSGTRLLLLNQWMGMVTAYPLILIMLVLLISHPIMFISSTLLSILIFSSLPVFFYAKKYNISEAFWAYTYSIFYTFGLFWITPYAMATANRRGWLTRGLPEKK